MDETGVAPGVSHGRGGDLMDRVLQRSSRLYSLPAVAIEVLRLTDDPRIDVAALKACIARDPALTAKVLRVVNSSLYGLSTEVGNLSQAVALLGINPLKLLVLGFSLPSSLMAELAGEQLQRYWGTALVRAVAARAIAEGFYHRDGDAAFILGLVDDIGMLAMLGALGEPYARFLKVVWEEDRDVRPLEREALGFDHGHLTTALLNQWKMPEALVRAMAAANSSKRLHHHADDPLPQVLYLARLAAGLVGRHRLSVLPELIEAGTELCGLDKPALNSLVEELEPKVAALAEALEVRLPDQRSYVEILAEAQSRMADLGEELAGPLARLERAEDLLAELKGCAAKDPLRGTNAGSAPLNADVASSIHGEGETAVHRAAEGERAQWATSREIDRLLAVLERAVAECRAYRDELVLALIDFSPPAYAMGPSPPPSFLSGLLARVCREFGIAHAEQLPLSGAVHALVLPHCTRRESIELVREVFSKVDGQRGQVAAPGGGGSSAGIASVDAPPRNFDPGRLLEAARRCLIAAQSSGGQIKSLEIS